MKKIPKSLLSLQFHQKLREKDERELYSQNPHDYYAITYRRRINKIIKTVIHTKPQKVLELGCAQGNISLQIAEKNIFTVAVDIDIRMLTYSKMKYEKGPIIWIVNNVTTPAFKPEIFDCIILAEVLEHCATPLEILSNVFKMLKKGGILIVTTPNGDSKLTTLPSYSEVKKQYNSISLRQFGPDGEDHLFAFRCSELKSLLKEIGFTIERLETFGHHFLHLQCLYHLRHSFPWFWNVVLENIITRIPRIRFIFTNGVFVVARKGN